MLEQFEWSRGIRMEADSRENSHAMKGESTVGVA